MNKSKKSFKNRTFTTLRLAVYDFKAKYAGSVFGFIWAGIEPIVTVIVYWFVYSVAANFSWSDDCPYYLWLSAGISAWLFISEGIKSMTSAFRDYAYLIKKTGFNKSSVLRIRAISCIFGHIIFFGNRLGFVRIRKHVFVRVDIPSSMECGNLFVRVFRRTHICIDLCKI